MISAWILPVYVMAEVMGHGGAGAGQDPPGGGRGGSDDRHYLEAPDLRPKKETRGKGKNIKLCEHVKIYVPMSLTYDREATFLPIGEVKDYFVREAGMYMWRNIPLNRRSWDNVSDAEKNALARHLAIVRSRVDIVPTVHATTTTASAAFRGVY